ncbi:hypothetical protein Sjap_018011 [Stephania japonica]|uniref:Uncharacterized protein n=1 Tax=Stephania japonica TaxID=461633 RepID=A0AAP0I7T6_9MAGN
MIRKFAFDFYMSISIWMSNIEEVVKVICMFMKHRELHPSHFCARRMTKVFKRWMIPEGYCWKSAPPHHKDQCGENGRYFLDGMMRFPRISCERHTTELASTRYTALMHKLKKNRVRPIYVEMRHGGDTCDRESEDFQARSRQATHENRNTEVEGPGTGPSKHGGGSVSFATTQERLAPERTSEATRATPEQSVDDEAVYLNVAGECSKGRVYGLGSVGRKKRGDTELLVLARRDAGCGAAGEFDVVAEQLRKVMNFMHQRLGMDMDEIGLAQQQPPPPPPPPPPHDQQQPPQIDPPIHPNKGTMLGIKWTMNVPTDDGGLLKPDVVEGTDDEDSSVSEVGVVGIVEASELGGGYGGFGAGGLGAYSLVVALRWRFRNASKLRFTY